MLAGPRSPKSPDCGEARATPESGKLVCDVEWEDEGKVSRMTNKKDRGEIPSNELKHNHCVRCPSKVGSWSPNLQQ